MKHKWKNYIKVKLSSIIIFSLVALAAVALLITNIFIPVKYLTAYLVSRANRTKGELRVTFLSVGYGDCTVIELPDGKTMLIDAGDGSYANTLRILKYLNSRSIDTIDYLVCSSVRSEHASGLAEIVKYKKISKAYIPYVLNTRITAAYHDFVTQLKSEKCATQIISYAIGEYSEEYGYFFAFLSPTDPSSSVSAYAALNSEATDKNINDASAVLWLQYGETAFAFTSDAGKEELKYIVDSYDISVDVGNAFCRIGGYSVELEECDVVTVAGHGNENCTYARWYERLTPEQAIISVGKNYSGCPSVKALTDVCSAVEQPLYTNEKENIIIKATRDGYTVI